MTRAAIALGSNVGDRLGHLRGAVDALRRVGYVVSVSSLYETEPVGGPEQGRYLNAVLVLDTELAATGLLQRLHGIEQAAGRQRRVQWEPRTLDLDIVCYGHEEVALDGLEIPHPRAADRRFVLAPLVEIWPSAPVGGGLTARQALERLPPDGVFRFEGDWVGGRPRLGGRGTLAVAAQLVLIFAILSAAAAGMTLPVPVWRSVVGLALAALGSWMVLGAALVLGRSLSALPDPVPGGSRSERGPYRLVRHPIYGGLLVGGAGLAVIAGTWLPVPFMAALAVLLHFKSGWEERALGVAYPDYPEYAGRVRRRFIPGVW